MWDVLNDNDSATRSSLSKGPDQRHESHDLGRFPGPPSYPPVSGLGYRCKVRTFGYDLELRVVGDVNAERSQVSSECRKGLLEKPPRRF